MIVEILAWTAVIGYCVYNRKHRFVKRTNKC